MAAKRGKSSNLHGTPAKEHIKEGQWVSSGGPFEGMNEAEKSAAVAELTRAHSENFSSSLARLKEICRTYNAFQLIGHFSYYDLVRSRSGKRSSRYTPAEQSAVELLQALILEVPADDLRSKIDARPPLKIFTELNKLLNGIIASFGLKRIGTRGDEANGLGSIQEMMRSHTAGVRNEGYASQVRRTMTEIVAPLDPEFEARRGLKLTHLAEMLWKITEMIDQRLNDQIDRQRAVFSLNTKEEIVTKFIEFHQIDQESAKNLRAEIDHYKYSLDEVRGYLVTIWDRNNFLLFGLTLEECVSAYPGEVDPSLIEWVISAWSLEHGALSGSKDEFFFLDNPVWSKPFIQFTERSYLLPIPVLIQSFGRRLLEDLIRLEGDLWTKYQNETKAKFLERFVTRLFKNAIPSADIFAGVKWNEPNSGIPYENDVFVVVDTQALIIECKSGSITPEARRGAPKRLAREIGKLIEEPTLQGQLFANYLSNLHGPIELEDIEHKKHLIDPRRFTRIARLNVTLDYFGPLGIQARKLRELGLVSRTLEPAATIPAHELECVADLLDKPPLLFHYLQRRAELEASTDLITNEGSLLALYLANGFDLGDLEGQESQALVFSMEEQLEPYFMGKELKHPVPKPRRRFTTWWRDMLYFIALRQVHGWMESSYGLLSCRYEQQKYFENGVKRMLKIVKRDWRNPDHCNVCSMVVGHPSNALTLMCVGLAKATAPQEVRQHVNKAFNLAQDRQSTAVTLAIVKSLATESYPYSASYIIKNRDHAKPSSPV